VLIDELYAGVRQTPSDIVEHLELLARLSSLCDHVTEFGVRAGNSTVALLYGRPRTLVSYDVLPCLRADEIERAAKEVGVGFVFKQESSLAAEIDPTDLLFIDTLHTFHQLTVELRNHASKVQRFIAFHDTTTFGDRDEQPTQLGNYEATGLWPAISRFLKSGRDWNLKFYATNNNGLTVIERNRRLRRRQNLGA
jgi:hypothetical protein